MINAFQSPKHTRHMVARKMQTLHCELFFFFFFSWIHNTDFKYSYVIFHLHLDLIFIKRFLDLK